MSAPKSGDVYEAPDGMRIRLRRPASRVGLWLWDVLRLGRDKRGKCPTLGGGRIDPTWTRLEAANVPRVP